MYCVVFVQCGEEYINFTCRSDEIIETKNPLFRKSSSSNVKQGTKISGIHTIIQSPHLQLIQHNLHYIQSRSYNSYNTAQPFSWSASLNHILLFLKHNSSYTLRLQIYMFSEEEVTNLMQNLQARAQLQDPTSPMVCKPYLSSL